MDGKFIALFRFQGPAMTLLVDNDSTFQEFKMSLSKKGVGEQFLSNNMTFKIESLMECALCSEEDWIIMKFLMKNSGNYVTITAENFIEIVSIPKPLNVGSEFHVASTSSSVSLVSGNTQNDQHVISVEPTNDPHIELPQTVHKVLLTESWANYIQSEGQSFPGGAIEFRVKLSKYMLEKGFKFRYIRNTDKQVIAECAKRETHNCNWYINATYTKLNGWFYVRKFRDQHCCPMEVRGDKRLSAQIIGALIVDKVKNNPGVLPKEIMDLFKGEYGLIITYKQAYRGIEKAQEYIYGCHVDSYHELKWYLLNLLKFNEGSRIEFEEGPVKNKKTGVITNRFLRAFVSFGAAITGFSHCRPMLFIDGTFLTGRYGGVLLSATAKDGDNGLFPFAFAIVSSENKDNWRWFLLNLLMILPEDRKIIFVSDRNVGLMRLFDNEFKDLQNFYCLQHLKNNLRDRLKGRAMNAVVKNSVINLFENAARAPTLPIFDRKIAEFLSEGGNTAKSFLDGLPLQKWAFAHAPCARFGEMTSNAAESYNNWIKDARDLPITQCVDLIRSKTMEQLHNRREKAAMLVGPLCAGLQQDWNAALQESRGFTVKRASRYVFECLCNPTIVVRLNEKKCDCFKWQFHGFPCSHAIAAIHASESTTKGLNAMEEYVDSYYFASTYKACYAGSITPVATILKLTDPVDVGERVFPPEKLRQPGRRQKRRIPSKGEFVKSKRKYKCTTCGGSNHNSKKCKEPIPG